jgi:hypothetical protein
MVTKSYFPKAIKTELLLYCLECQAYRHQAHLDVTSVGAYMKVLMQTHTAVQALIVQGVVGNSPRFILRVKKLP